ncbi:putative powdery mildew resistance protein, RPW8 [Helianthus debilis subsp. tardiflorus]
MAVDPFSEPIFKLSDAVIHVIQTTADFKPQLTQLENTLDRIAPIIVDIQNQNRKLDRTRLEQEMFIDEIQDAQKLVNKCLKIKWNFFKRFTHSLKLKDLDQKLVRFFQVEVQAVQCRDIKKTLEEVNHVGQRITSLALDVRHLGQTLDSGSSKREHVKSERKKLGWPVPPLPRGIVGFDEPLNKLKEKVLSDVNTHDDMDGNVGKVVVVSATGGCGKTTLVKMLGNDPQIQDVFGENVFFVTVSETPDFMVSVNDLFNPNCFDQQESYIKNFEFDIQGYKLLVTSRMLFPKYDVFKFDPLSDEDARILFRCSARPISTIDENLVDQMVKCCKNHPLTLSVVGGSLDGKNEVVWRSMLKSLSQGHLVLDLNKEILNRLERSFETLEDKFKQCFLDFGLFLEDQRIPASALLDMWVHLYKHDDEGVDTLAKIYELSYRNLVDVMDPRYFHFPCYFDLVWVNFNF